jgi:hypothetical protein
MNWFTAGETEHIGTDHLKLNGRIRAQANYRKKLERLFAFHLNQNLLEKGGARSLPFCHLWQNSRYNIQESVALLITGHILVIYFYY